MLQDSEDPSFHSTTYGVTEQSPLNTLQYYHTCNFGLPPDAMHDLFEGYVKLCTNLLIKQLIEIDRYFKLLDLNNAIQNFKYSSSEAKSKPTIITAKEMSTQHMTLNQSGKYVFQCIITSINIEKNINKLMFYHLKTRRCLS